MNGYESELNVTPLIDVLLVLVVMWNGTSAASEQQLEQWFASASHASPQPIIKVWPERRSPYERVAQVLAAAQRARVTAISLAPVKE
jgi:biopolymer transport protein ExbD